MNIQRRGRPGRPAWTEWARRLAGLVALVSVIATLVGCDGAGQETGNGDRVEAGTDGDRRRVVWEGDPSGRRDLAAVRAGERGVRSAGQDLAAFASAGSGIPVYELTMNPSAFRALERNSYSDATQPARFRAGDTLYEHVRVRFRGAWARSWPKKPLKIFFSDDQRFAGHRSLNLNSAWRDPAFLREALAYHIYAACGVPASRAQPVIVGLNGQFLGLYLEVEQVDKTLLRRLDLRGASLFKAGSDENQADERDLGSERAFAGHYENETQGEEGLRDLHQFCRELQRSADTLAFFNAKVDLDRYINYLAAGVLVQNWDCYNKNHFMVFDRRGSQKWFAMPWDLDRTLGDHWHGGFDEAELPVLLGTRRLPGPTGWNRLQERFFSEATLRARFFERLHVLLETEFTPEKLFPLLDAWEADIASAAAMDRQQWGGPGGDLRRGMAGLKSFIERRREFLRGEIAREKTSSVRAAETGR